MSAPFPPTNVQVITGYQSGVLDIRWDNPIDLFENTTFEILGVNIYRSVGTDRGPFHRINQAPVGGSFYRDLTSSRKITKEVVTDWISKGHTANNKAWILRTNFPIHKKEAIPPYDTPTFANKPKDVRVFIDGVEVVVDNVFGRSHEITIVNQSYFDPIREVKVNPVLPTANSVITVSYWTNENYIPSSLGKKIFYRVTAVALDDTNASGLSETALSDCQAVSNIEVETLDYIWREAMRRNNWILEQGGERVKLFVRKQMGIVCNCTRDERTLEYSKQPSNRCLTCYGTGFVGGYEGPYEIIIAPDDAERKISQSQYGRRLEHTYEVFMGASPVVTQRDFIVKQTNERYSIGAVRRPTNRGNLLQQHFQIGYLDEGDIKYKVPITGTSEMDWPETRDIKEKGVPLGTTYAPSEEGTDPMAIPQATDKANIADGREKRGRTRVWENQNY